MRDSIKLGVVLALAAALAGTILCFQVLSYQTAVAIKATLERSYAMTTITSTWTSGGVPKSLTTTRREGESAEDFARRHKEELDAMLLIFPKDP